MLIEQLGFYFTKKINKDEAEQLRKGNEIVVNGVKYEKESDKEIYINGGSNYSVGGERNISYISVLALPTIKDGWSCKKKTEDYRSLDFGEDWDEYIEKKVKFAIKINDKENEALNKHEKERFAREAVTKYKKYIVNWITNAGYRKKQKEEILYAIETAGNFFRWWNL